LALLVEYGFPVVAEGLAGTDYALIVGEILLGQRGGIEVEIRLSQDRLRFGCTQEFEMRPIAEDKASRGILHGDAGRQAVEDAQEKSHTFLVRRNGTF
jgi:hypothetical protein